MIIPIVYYEGKEKWTADRKLSARIECSDKMKAYIPEFVYKVVRVHDYTNEELQNHCDEMSLVMMLNKIQTPEDYSDLLEVSRDYVDSVYDKASGSIKKILNQVVWSLLIKMNVPVEEAEKMVEVLETDGMGYLFENMEKMDIQAERENTRKARERAESAEKRTELAVKNMVLRQQSTKHTKEETQIELQLIFGLDEATAKQKVETYWA